ncbi:MAG: OmpA family protein [Pseudomonadota bacterium]
MRTQDLIALCLLAALAGPAAAQDDTSDAEAPTEEVMEEEMADEATEADAMEADMADDAADSETMETDMADAAAEAETMETDMADEGDTAETMETDMADEATDGDAMEAEMAEEAEEAADAMETEMADEAAEEAPSLEEIAASDPALDVRTNEEGEVDAMVMLSDVLFDFGDASLAPEALDVLAGIGEKLDGVASIEITGHTDAVGDEDFNLGLGQRRADTVRDWLIANTPLTADVVTASSAGEDDPVAGNDTSEGRALNRRVEFTLPEGDS